MRSKADINSADHLLESDRSRELFPSDSDDSLQRHFLSVLRAAVLANAPDLTGVTVGTPQYHGDRRSYFVEVKFQGWRLDWDEDDDAPDGYCRDVLDDLWERGDQLVMSRLVWLQPKSIQDECDNPPACRSVGQFLRSIARAASNLSGMSHDILVPGLIPTSS